METNSSKTFEEFVSVGGGSVLFETSSGFKVTSGYLSICIVTAAIGVCIIVLNAIVINTLIGHKRWSDMTDYFVSSLSVADLVTGVVLLYLTSYNVLQYQHYTECLIRFGMTNAVTLSSTGHLTALILDRFVKITKPFLYHTIFTTKSVIAISAAIWTVSLTYGALPVLGWSKTFEEDENFANIKCRYFGRLPNSYLWFGFVLFFSLYVTTLCLYAHLIRLGRRRARETAAVGNQSSHMTSQITQSSWRRAKTVFIVVGVSNVCWLPSALVIVLHLVGALDDLSYFDRGSALTYSTVILFLNSLINPIIYAIKIPRVRTRFRRLCCCCRHTTSTSQSQMPNNIYRSP